MWSKQSVPVNNGEADPLKYWSKPSGIGRERREEKRMKFTTIWPTAAHISWLTAGRIQQSNKFDHVYFLFVCRLLFGPLWIKLTFCQPNKRKFYFAMLSSLPPFIRFTAKSPSGARKSGAAMQRAWRGNTVCFQLGSERKRLRLILIYWIRHKHGAEINI